MPELPVSDALSEASPYSISELFNRAPAENSHEDDLRIVAELRANRERHEAAEAAGVKVPKGQTAEEALRRKARVHAPLAAPGKLPGMKI